MDLHNEESRNRFRWPVFADAIIDADAGKVWAAISESGSLVDCHPFCKSNPVSQWPGAGAVDEVHYLNGLVYERRFRAWHEGTGFDLEIFHKDKTIAWVSWRIAALDDDHAALTIKVYPMGLQGRPLWLRWVPHLFVLRPRLRAYLSSVVGGYRWFIEKGEAVPRNAFGRHPWFSAP